MIILCADDFGLTDGVTKAIEALAERRRISATSAIVTRPGWPGFAHRLAALRGNIAIGLHLNLTLGSPLGPMPRLAPEGTFPPLGELIRLALMRQLDKSEIRDEISRQLARFEDLVGTPPDHVDGHQHVHALPVVRDELIPVLAESNRLSPPLVRNPADTIANILGRAQSPYKSFAIAALSAGFSSSLQRAGLPSNDTFSGVSGFQPGSDFRNELTASLSRAGSRHIAMCHPGFADEELRKLDPVVERREEEYRTLMDAPGLPPRIWHPDREADGPTVNWSTEQ